MDALVKSLKNPLTIASLVSVVLALLSVRLPTALDRTARQLSNMTTGLALMMLGAQFELGGGGSRLKWSLLTVLVRLVLIPLAVVSGAAALGYRGPELVAIYIYFAPPCAVNNFILADRLGGDAQMAADAVLSTTCASLATMVAGVWIMRSLALF